MTHLKLPLALLFFVVCAASVRAEPVIIPAPLNSPVFISLDATPVVMIGPRTIDFTPNLSQEFINFVALQQSFGTVTDPVFRLTIGLRARDGLASLSAVIPPSPDPFFANTLPSFTPGTSDLILFDVVIAGYGTPFTITLTDINGDANVAEFSTPIPEPATVLLLGTALLAAAILRRDGSCPSGGTTGRSNSNSTGGRWPMAE